MNVKLMFIMLSLIISTQIKENLSQTSIINGNFYSKINKFNDFNLNGTFLLSCIDTNSILKCLTKCSKTVDCFYMVYQQTKCFICNFNFINFGDYIQQSEIV